MMFKRWFLPLFSIALVLFAVYSYRPTPNCSEIEGKPVLFTSGPLFVVATDSPGVDLYAFSGGGLRWSRKLPGRVTLLSWAGEGLVVGTDSGYLFIFSKEGKQLMKEKLPGEPFLMDWSEGFVVVARSFGPEGEVSYVYPLGIRGRGIYYVKSFKGGLLLGFVNHTLSFLKDGLKWRLTCDEILDANETVAIRSGEKVLLINEEGQVVRSIDFPADMGCWQGDLYLYGLGGLYRYEGRLKPVIKAKFYELSCNPLRGVVKLDGEWYVFLEGKFYNVPDRPYNLQWWDGRLAFTYSKGVGFIKGEVTLLSGEFAGWADGSLIVYRDGEVCITSTRG